MENLFELAKHDEIKLTENARIVLEKRYLSKDESGKLIETPAQLFRRVAKTIASVEKNFINSPYKADELEEIFYKLMANFEFLPNSPTLMNAGRPLGQLSACFVLPVPDSLDGIFEAIKHAALIHKSGGGTGFSFSRLRPANDIVATTSGVSSGPVSFMRVFNTATETIKQGGTRRGANMGILRVDHPDIIEFITCKQDNNSLTNFNISVAITDHFMEALENDQEYELINPRTQKQVKKIKASTVFNLIVENAWKNGEPGVVFIDRINRDNPTPHVGEIESTNPCGEQPLLPYESCNLGSINLSKFVKHNNKKYTVDYEKLKNVVHLAVRFLDNVIEINKYPIPEIEKMTKANRKIGLGIMGWADLLLRLRIPYNSENAVNLAEEIMGFIRSEAWQASKKLAEERGHFPNYPGSLLEKKGMPPVRNATVTTIAPTGSISIIASCSSGIEPLFAIAFVRNVLDKQKLIEVNPIFVEVAKEFGFYSKELIEKIATYGTLKNISEIPDWVRKVFVTAHEISPEWHIRMQAAFQKHTDNAVSKTVNFPHDATLEDVEKVFKLAYTLGCKGVTVYRDGSRQTQVITTGAKDKNKENYSNKITPRPRPVKTTGITERAQIGCGNLYITVNSDDQGICEVFTNLGRGGGCPSQSEATARLVSMALRSGIDVLEIIDQLKGIRCLSTMKKSNQNGYKVLSCPDAIARVVEQMYYQQNTTNKNNSNSNESDNTLDNNSINSNLIASDAQLKCPECQAQLSHDGGCVICNSCGYSKCG